MDNKISAVEAAIATNDLSKLTADQRASYYNQFCQSVGLNPLTQPLSYITLNGKLTLYAGKGASDQLRSIKGISVTKVDTKETDTTYEVIVYGKDRTGREDSDMGVLDITGLKGEKLANAKMKALTKAKRRLTLSLAGLGVLDETEVETIKDAKIHSATLLDAPRESSSQVGAIESEYIIPFGVQFKGKTLEEVGVDNLIQYMDKLDAHYEKTKKQMDEQTKEFYIRAGDYINQAQQ